MRPQCKSLFRSMRKFYRDEVSESGGVNSYVREKLLATDSEDLSATESEDLSLNLRALTESKPGFTKSSKKSTKKPTKIP